MYPMGGQDSPGHLSCSPRLLFVQNLGHHVQVSGQQGQVRRDMELKDDPGREHIGGYRKEKVKSGQLVEPGRSLSGPIATWHPTAYKCRTLPTPKQTLRRTRKVLSAGQLLGLTRSQREKCGFKLCGNVPLSVSRQNSGERQRWEDRSSRSSLATERVAGQLGLHETLFQK